MRLQWHLCLVLGSLAQRHLQETSGDPAVWQVNSGNLCALGSTQLNETPGLQLCNCGGQASCRTTGGGFELQFLDLLLASGINGSGSVTLNIGADMWPSRRFRLHQDILDATSDPLVQQPYVHTEVSSGMGAGFRYSGAYAGFTAFVSESGLSSIQVQDFIQSTPQTAFMTTEVTRLQACIEPELPARRLQGDGDGDGMEASSNETEVVDGTDPEALPTEVLCDVNTEISPGRVKLSLYGYTWGQNWEQDVAAAGQDYVFYRWRLCFQSRSWYINQKLSGEGVVDTDENVEVIDFQQEDSTPLVYYFPKHYLFGNHLNCTLAQDLYWNFPQWECPNDQHLGAVHVTASSAGGACPREGLILNIGFHTQHLYKKDRWFLYMLEVNSSTTVTFSSISMAESRMVSLALLVPFLLQICNR